MTLNKIIESSIEYPPRHIWLQGVDITINLWKLVKLLKQYGYIN